VSRGPSAIAEPLVCTGLYAESHGIVDNFMYDVDHGEEFLIGTNPAQYHSYWWNDGEPLWITATKQVQGRGQELRLGMGVVVRISCWGPLRESEL